MFIDQIVRFLLPRQDLFFTLLDGIAAKMETAANVFGELASISGHEKFAAIAAQMKTIETEADHLCHELYDKIDQTFVTPIDREDLANVTRALDDVIDGMEHSAAFAALFHFEVLTEPMQQLVRITTRAVPPLKQAVHCLRHFGKPSLIREPNVAVHTLENEADLVYRAAIETLFRDDMAPRELVRQKDMLFSLEMGVDVCEDAMDAIRSVVVKNG
jgi:uncharacterized protein Yka (UPF0111/DUF47 family)